MHPQALGVLRSHIFADTKNCTSRITGEMDFSAKENMNFFFPVNLSLPTLPPFLPPPPHFCPLTLYLHTRAHAHTYVHTYTGEPTRF